MAISPRSLDFLMVAARKQTAALGLLREALAAMGEQAAREAALAALAALVALEALEEALEAVLEERILELTPVAETPETISQSETPAKPPTAGKAGVAAPKDEAT